MANPLAPVTLTPDEVETFTLDGQYLTVEILKFGPGSEGTDEIYGTADGTTPTVEGAGCFLITAAQATHTVDAVSHHQATIVKLISAGNPKVSVRGL